MRPNEADPNQPCNLFLTNDLSLSVNANLFLINDLSLSVNATMRLYETNSSTPFVNATPFVSALV